MKFIAVFHARRIKQFMLIFIASFFTAGLIYVEQSEMMVFSTSDHPSAFYKAKTNEPFVALTFNLSWGENKLVPILDVLDENNVDHATFFVSASWAERYPDLAELILEKGHTIGNHGYEYKTYTGLDDDKVRRDIRRSSQVLTEITGEKPNLLRPPNGLFDRRILKIAEEEGQTIIHWSIDSKDYQNPGTEAIVQNVVSKAEKGDVILLHASDSVKQTEKALPQIITQLRKKGYTFTSLEDLMENSEVTHEEIQ